MKSERRHELQKNDLEQVLEKGMEQMGPQAKIVAGVVIAVLVAGIAVTWFQYQNKMARASGWGELFTASALMGQQDAQMTPALEAVGSAYHGRPAGAWAELFLGYDLYRQGLEKYFTQPDDAKLDLERSIKAFENARNTADVPELKQRAMWGIGQSSEVLATKESIQTATETYEKLSSQFPDSPFGKWAGERLELLKSKGTEEFYVWYSEQDFAPKASPTTGILNQDLPSDPNLTLPSRDALTRPGSTGGLLDGPGAAPINLMPENSGLPQPGEGDLMPQPETPSTEPSADSPAPSAPPTADEKPAEEAKPAAEEKPAAEAPKSEPAPETPAETEEKPATDEQPAAE